MKDEEGDESSEKVPNTLVNLEDAKDPRNEGMKNDEEGNKEQGAESDKGEPSGVPDDTQKGKDLTQESGARIPKGRGRRRKFG